MGALCETFLASDNFCGGRESLKGNFVGLYAVQTDGLALAELHPVIAENAGFFRNTAGFELTVQNLVGLYAWHDILLEETMSIEHS